MKVALTLNEREFVKAAADARTDANAGTSDIPDYDHRRFNLSSRQANRLGVFAEAVAFKALGGSVLEHDLTEWAHFVPNNHPNYEALVKGQADLNLNGLSVEVRRANSPGSPIPIRDKDRKPGIFVVQVYVPYVQPLPSRENPFPGITVGMHAELVGWANATDQGTVPDWAKQKGTVVVPRRSMTDFKGLV